MEKALVIALLEKYWQAETTIAEEQALAAYFQGGEIDPELEAYSDLFSYFHEEARVSAGPGFGNRILERLGLPPDPIESAAAEQVRQVPVVPMNRRTFSLGVAGAAAAIVLIVAGLFLLRPSGPSRMLAETGPQTQNDRLAIAPVPAGSARFTDTYDDPQQALAAVRRALLVASRNLNHGRREISGASK